MPSTVAETHSVCQASEKIFFFLQVTFCPAEMEEMEDKPDTVPLHEPDDAGANEVQQKEGSEPVDVEVRVEPSMFISEEKLC